MNLIRSPLSLVVTRAAITAYGPSYLASILRAAGWGRGLYWCEPDDRHGVRVTIYHVPGEWST